MKYLVLKSYTFQILKYKFGKKNAGIAVIKTINISKELRRKKRILEFMINYQKKITLVFQFY